jgi:ribosomal-protein-alanine N-acetyltransferase
MADQAHITGIAVRGTHRGHGIGELMLISSIKEAIRRCSSVVTLEVRVSNNVAQSLYSKYGFKEMGLRKRYYVDNHEDAYIMTTDSITSAEYISMMDSLVDQYISRYPEVRLIGG